MEQEAEEIARQDLAAWGDRLPVSRDRRGAAVRPALRPDSGNHAGAFRNPGAVLFRASAGFASSGVVSGRLVRALLAGWNHADLAALLRMPVSGVGATAAGDRFDFRFAKSLPGRGLPLREIADAPEILASLAELSRWNSKRLEPAEWAARLKGW